MLGLGLDADAVRALDVATSDGPDDAAEEDQADGVAECHIAAVDVAVEELERRRHLVVDLEHRGDGEESEEPEVDHRVHEAGAGITEQGLHVDACTEVLQSLWSGLRRGLALRRGTTLPVLHPVGEHDPGPHQEHGDDRVEGDLQRPRDVREHHSMDLAVALPLGDLRDDARDQREECDGGEQDECQLVRLDPCLRCGLIRGCFGSATHADPKLPAGSSRGRNPSGEDTSHAS